MPKILRSYLSMRLTPVIPTLRRIRQENYQEFEASLSYSVSPGLQNQTKTN